MSETDKNDTVAENKELWRSICSGYTLQQLYNEIEDLQKWIEKFDKRAQDQPNFAWFSEKFKAGANEDIIMMNSIINARLPHMLGFTSIPIEVFLDNVLPHLQFSSLQRLSQTCKDVNVYIDQECVWRDFVKLNKIPWKEEDFVAQDTGGTSRRLALSERMDEIAIFKSFYQSRDVDVRYREVLNDPKGLLLNVATQMHHRHQYIHIGIVD